MGGVFCKLGPSEPEDEQPAQKTYSWYVRMHVYVCVCMCMCVCVCVSLSFSPPSLCLNALFLFANLRDTRETKDPSQFQFKDLKGFVPHRFKQRLGTHTHSLLHSLSHVLTHSLTYSLTHSLTFIGVGKQKASSLEILGMSSFKLTIARYTLRLACTCHGCAGTEARSLKALARLLVLFHAHADCSY